MALRCPSGGGCLTISGYRPVVRQRFGRNSSVDGVLLDCCTARKPRIARNSLDRLPGPDRLRCRSRPAPHAHAKAPGPDGAPGAAASLGRRRIHRGRAARFPVQRLLTENPAGISKAESAIGSVEIDSTSVVTVLLPILLIIPAIGPLPENLMFISCASGTPSPANSR